MNKVSVITPGTSPLGKKVAPMRDEVRGGKRAGIKCSFSFSKVSVKTQPLMQLGLAQDMRPDLFIMNVSSWDDRRMSKKRIALQKTVVSDKNCDWDYECGDLGCGANCDTCKQSRFFVAKYEWTTIGSSRTIAKRTTRRNTSHSRGGTSQHKKLENCNLPWFLIDVDQFEWCWGQNHLWRSWNAKQVKHKDNAQIAQTLYLFDICLMCFHQFLLFWGIFWKSKSLSATKRRVRGGI